MRHITKHWCERVAERIGGDTDPVALWQSIHEAIETGNTERVEYLGRHKPLGRRRFRFRVPDGRRFVVVAVDGCRGLVPLTVLPDATRTAVAARNT